MFGMNSPVENVSNPIRKGLVTFETAKHPSGHILPDKLVFQQEGSKDRQDH